MTPTEQLDALDELLAKATAPRSTGPEGLRVEGNRASADLQLENWRAYLPSLIADARRVAALEAEVARLRKAGKAWFDYLDQPSEEGTFAEEQALMDAFRAALGAA